MEILLGILEDITPFILTGGGTIIAVLLGAYFNNRFTRQRERDKWLMDNLILSLKKSVFLIKKVDKLYRHCLIRSLDESGKVIKLPGEVGEPNMASEEPGEQIEYTLDPKNPETDAKAAIELSAEIEAEVFFLIINCIQFRRTKTSAEELETIMEQSKNHNGLIIAVEYRRRILVELKEIGKNFRFLS